jgi:hypothetical protein
MNMFEIIGFAFALAFPMVALAAVLVVSDKLYSLNSNKQSTLNKALKEYHSEED